MEPTLILRDNQYSDGLYNFQESYYAPETIPSDLVDGARAIRTPFGAARLQRLAECMNFWAQARNGHIPTYLIREALAPNRNNIELHQMLMRNWPTLFTQETMTTSDFSILTDNMMERMILADYQAYTPTWRGLAKVRTGIKDFRTLRAYTRSGGQQIWGEAKELQTFDRRTIAQTYMDWTIKKYRAGWGMSWESVINDDLSFFGDMASRVGLGGAYTVEDFVTRLYCGASGPDATLYSAGNGNIIKANINGVVTTNPTLSLDAFAGALEILMGFTDPTDGTPIVTMNSRLQLVVGSPALVTVAQRMKNQLTTYRNTTNAGGTAVILSDEIRNYLADMFDIVYNPWIKKVATTANADTSWWLFAGSPAQGFVGRPAIEVGFLQGFESPQLFKKMPNAVRIGGGAPDQAIGDFDTMSNEYMGVLVFGGHTVDAKSTVASNGTNA